MTSSNIEPRDILKNMPIASLIKLKDALGVDCTGHSNRKITYTIPLEAHLREHKDKLSKEPLYQHLYGNGVAEASKPRTISTDKAAQDAAVAKSTSKPTPAMAALLKRNMTSDPPGLPVTGSKKVHFAQVNVLLHGILSGDKVQEMLVPLQEGVRPLNAQGRAAPTSDNDEKLFVQLDDLFSGVSAHNASPLKGLRGRIQVRNHESMRMRDVGSVPKLLLGDYTSFSHLEAAKRHLVRKSGDNYELDLFYQAPSGGDTASLANVPGAILGDAPSAATVPLPTQAGGAQPPSTQAPVLPASHVTPAPIAAATKAAADLLNLDGKPEFHRALAEHFSNNGVPVWMSSKAEIMSQRLARYLHVRKALDVIRDWKQSLTNFAYDIPFDWPAENERWAGGHFTIKAVRLALGLKHTTASEDQQAFTAPRNAPPNVLKRLQPILDWVESPDDERLATKFGRMSHQTFTSMRAAVLEKGAKIDVDDLDQTFDGKDLAKSASSSTSHNREERRRQPSGGHGEDRASSSKGRKRKERKDTSDDDDDEISFVKIPKKKLARLTKKRSLDYEELDSDSLDF